MNFFYFFSLLSFSFTSLTSIHCSPPHNQPSYIMPGHARAAADLFRADGITRGQRSLNLASRPGSSSRSGIVPGMTLIAARYAPSRSGGGVHETPPCTGACGEEKMAATGPPSTNPPAYMMAACWARLGDDPEVVRDPR